MLKERSFEVTYREYTKDPLTREELVEVLSRLGMSAHDMLRARDAKKQGIDPKSISDSDLLDAMAANNRLLQRPILITDKGARVGRPAEQLLEVL